MYRRPIFVSEADNDYILDEIKICDHIEHERQIQMRINKNLI